MQGDNQRVGKFGETLAQEYLIHQKYQILETNYTVFCGEIDIIALQTTGTKDKKNAKNAVDTLVFFEIKTRKSDKYGLPSEAVGRAKQRKIASVASHYIKHKKCFDCSTRYDVIEVDLAGTIRHIENAFESSLRI
ncbi:MAG: YraN family protein [Firmicutes bacterium]|nr:YraN family protein [Bacillota bacterium]